MPDYYFFLLQRITNVLCVLPLLVGIINYKHLGRELKPIFILAVIVIITELLNHITSIYNIISFPHIRIYTAIEFTCIVVFYKRFFNERIKSVYFYILIGTFYAVALLDAFIINSIYHSDTLASSVSSLLIVMAAVFAFYIIMKYMLFENLLQTSFFWINSALLLYFAGTLFLFAFLNTISGLSKGSYIQLYSINSFLNLANYLLISIGFWKARKV